MAGRNDIVCLQECFSILSISIFSISRKIKWRISTSWKKIWSLQDLKEYAWWFEFSSFHNRPLFNGTTNALLRSRKEKLLRITNTVLPGKTFLLIKKLILQKELLKEKSKWRQFCTFFNSNTSIPDLWKLIKLFKKKDNY